MKYMLLKVLLVVCRRGLFYLLFTACPSQVVPIVIDDTGYTRTLPRITVRARFLD